MVLMSIRLDDDDDDNDEREKLQTLLYNKTAIE